MGIGHVDLAHAGVKETAVVPAKAAAFTPPRLEGGFNGC